ncbi:hypothetical protein [Streptomyces marincola]|uniref:hypothetical protein n=1 Tax=Streptomyces marincola TaxID=2878388 RepID=UPI001CF54673|nr:hypothetical protein [Streptomyces marincola]UCM89937.1 hypothetical protein LC193_19380 [Streptomyces marincola]
MSGNGRKRIWRHRFEPARLVLGVALIGVAVVYVAKATGRGDVPLPLLFALLPAALVAAALVAMAAMAARRARRGARDLPPGAAGPESEAEPEAEQAREAVSRTDGRSAGPGAR